MSGLGWDAPAAARGSDAVRDDATAARRRRLAQFLLARNAETMDDAPRLHFDDCPAASGAGAAACSCGYPNTVTAHCSARWRVVSLVQTLERWANLHPGVAGDTSAEHLMVLHEVMAALATAYADHPDYRPDLW